LLTFWMGKFQLGSTGSVPSLSPCYRNKTATKVFNLFLAIAIGTVVGIMYLLLYHPKEASVILILASLSVIGTLLFFMYKEAPEVRRKMGACLILIALSVGFWAVYNQTFTSLMLFADRNMSKEFLGFTINAEFTQFFNPFFIILLSPLLSLLWVKLDKVGKNPSTPMKFSFGILFMALGFLVLGGGIMAFPSTGQASPWWLVLSYFIQTIGELLISPIGLAMVTRLSPKHLVGMMMGVWFLTQAAAFAIGGTLAVFSNVPKGVRDTVPLAIYSRAFFVYGGISLLLAVLSFFLVPYLRGLIGVIKGVTPTPKR